MPKIEIGSMVDVSPKVFALMGLTNAEYNQMTLVERLVSFDGKKHTDAEMDAHYQAFRSLIEGSVPKGGAGYTFLDRVEDYFKHLGATPRNIKHIFVKGSYAEFYHMLVPKEQYGGIPHPEDNMINPRDKDHESIYPLWLATQFEIKSATEGFSTGRIDMEHLYAEEHNVDLWYKLARDDTYRQYSECLGGLNKLVSSEFWRDEMLRTGKLSGVVMLGGGAPAKDKAILRSLLAHTPQDLYPTYLVVDYSLPMLLRTRNEVHKAVRAEFQRPFHFALHRQNFYFLDSITESLLPRQNASVAWFLPGGTIGNLNEVDLYRAILRKAKPGDLIVISAEVYRDEKDIEETEEKYKNPAFTRFVEAPFRQAWFAKEKGPVKLLENILSAKKQVTVDGVANKYSFIPGAKTVEVSVHHGRPIALLVSTRYIEQNFIEFGKQQGLEFIETVYREDSPRFKQFVFRVPKAD